MDSHTTHDAKSLLDPLRRLHEMIRRAVTEACERSSVEEVAAVAREDDEGDTIYEVDCVSEELLIDFFEREVAPQSTLVLIAEGLTGGKVVLPRGLAAQQGYSVVHSPARS